LINIDKINDKELKVTFQYNSQLVNKIRKVDGRKWEANKKCWIVPYNSKCINELIKVFANEDINWGKSLNFSIIEDNDCKFPDISSALEQLERQLTLKGYSWKTKKSYIGHVRRFLEFTYDKPEVQIPIHL